MGCENSKTRPDEPEPENRSADAGRTAEVHETQPSHEPPSDVPQVTTEVHGVEDRTQLPTQDASSEDSKKQPTPEKQPTPVEDNVQQPTPEENEGQNLGQSQGAEGQKSQEASKEGSETPTLAKTSGSSKVVGRNSEEGKRGPELIKLLENIIENITHSMQPDIVRLSCEVQHLGEGSGNTLPPRVSKEQSEALPPAPTVETVDAKAQKEVKESHRDARVADVIGAQASGLAAQQESQAISDAAMQKVPTGEDAVASAGMTEEKGAEICACTCVLKTEEKKGTQQSCYIHPLEEYEVML